jgi:hypothetical protein
MIEDGPKSKFRRSYTYCQAFLSPELMRGELPETQLLLCEHAIDLQRQFLQAPWIFLDSGMDADLQPTLFS